MSFAQPFAVGVGEPGLGSAPPPLRPGRAGGSQGGRLLQSERNSTFNGRASTYQKNEGLLKKVFLFFWSLPPQLVLQVKLESILGYLVHLKCQDVGLASHPLPRPG